MGLLSRILKSQRITASLVVGLAILAVVALLGWLGPLFVDVDKALVGSVPPSLSPTGEYPLGTDSQGRDMLAVMVTAIPQTLKIGLIAGLVGIGVGLLLGLLSGFFGGPIDAVVRVLADSLMTVPGIAILIIIAANVEAMSVELMGLTVASLAWMYPTRTIRAQVLSIRERAYMLVARANGQSELEALFREVMPNLLPYIAASLVGSINGAILATVGLESLGLGAQDVHTLGTTIYWARRFSAILRGQWWWWGPPIATISIIFIGLFLLSLGLDRIANPTLAGQPKFWRRAFRQGAGQGRQTEVQRPAGTSATPAVLRVEDLRVVFETPAGAGPAVDGVSFSLRPGERMGLVGESGCGKTTMATALMAMTRPPGRIEGGRVVLEGRDLLTLSDAELRRMRLKEIALMPQAAMNSLNPVMRIGEQILDAVVAHAGAGSQQGLDGIVEQALSRVGLSPAVANRFPHQLSGGMKQRAAMAIATVLRPKVIIADEPTSALDVVVQRQVMLTLKRVQSDLGAAMLLIGHDIGLIAQFSDTIGVLYAGKLVERGPIAAVLDAPAHPYTRLLIDSLPGLDSRKEFIGIPGLPPALFDRPTGCHFHPRCPFAFDRCRTETPVLQTLNGQRPEPVEGQRRESIEGQRPEPVEGQRPEPVEGWQVACHLYPSHVQLPPLPAKSVFVGGDRATLSPESATLPPESAPARAGQSSSEGDLSTAGATPGRREPEEAQP